MTTYAWAFIVLIGLVGAMSYFAVLSPDSFVGERCDAPAGFLCEDFVIGEDSASFLFVNILGRNIEVVNAYFESEGNSDSCSTPSGVVRDREKFEVICGSLSDTRGNARLEYRHVGGSTLDSLRSAVFIISGVRDPSYSSGFVYEFSGGSCEYPEQGIGGLEPCIEFDPTLTNVFSVSSWEETSNPGARKITIGPLDTAGVIYECRTAHVSNIASTPWSNCDGASGTQPVHYIEQDGNHLRGNYRTDIRFRVGSDVSEVTSYEYYMWSYDGYTENLHGQPGLSQSLSQVCTNAENHDAFFDAALQHISKTGAFHPSTNLDGPEMIIQWNSGSNEFASFKKELHFNDDNNLIILKRRYSDVNENRCTLPFKNRRGSWSTAGFNSDSSVSYWCDAIVFNRNGNAVCLARQGDQIIRRGEVVPDIRRAFSGRYNQGVSSLQYFSIKYNAATVHSNILNQFDEYGNPLNPESDNNINYPRYLIIN